MNMTQKIEEKLNDGLSPTILKVINQSHLHSGHAGDDGSGESHFHIELASDAFEGQSRIAKERLVHKALGDIMTQIHALSVKVLST